MSLKCNNRNILSQKKIYPGKVTLKRNQTGLRMAQTLA